MGLPKNTPTTISLVLSEFLSCSFDEWDKHDLDDWEEDFDELYWTKGKNSLDPIYIRKDVVTDYLKKASTLGWERAEELMDEALSES